MSTTIAIVAPSSVPFQIGGAEKFWLGLHRALARYSGCAVELIKLPCREETFAEVVQSYKTFSRLDLSHFGMVISTKYPAWMVSHHNHVVYLQHTLRGLYDTYHFTGLPEQIDPVPTALRDLMALVRSLQPTRNDLHTAFELIDRALTTKSLPSSLFAHPGPLLREVVHFFDRVALAPSQISAYLAIADNVTKREDYFPQDVPIKVLHHPSDILEYANTGQKYFFTASRLTKTKRVDLIVEAMRYVPSDIPLLIAGTGPELPHLQDLAAGDPRIRFLGFVPDEELPGLYANALAVPYTPWDEDYGLITIEAMHSGKPVITTRDAGGPCEFVTDGETGCVCAPKPEALGNAMAWLVTNPALPPTLGRNAQQRVAHITWPETIRAFMDYTAQCSVSKAKYNRKTVLVLSTFPADESGTGGQRRLFHLCRALAQYWHVLCICYDQQCRQGHTLTELGANMQMLRMPFGAALEEAANLRSCTGESVDDIALMRTCAQDEDFAAQLAIYGKNAVCAVLAHPFLYPALHERLPELPFIYDAHNVEADLKAQLLPPDLAAEVTCVEQMCAQHAHAVLACSADDRERLISLFALRPDHCHVLPNGCDISHTTYTSTEDKLRLRFRLDYPEAKLALFLGSGHTPNVEAALHIFHMAPSVPEVQFLLAGTVSTQERVRKQPRPANVHLLGSVSENVKNILLKAADVALNPMTSGSGTNLKVVEYLAYGLETISTPFGMRGLPEDVAACAHSVPLEVFPLAIRDVVKTPGKDTARAVALVGKKLSWTAVLTPLHDIVTAATGEEC